MDVTKLSIADRLVKSVGSNDSKDFSDSAEVHTVKPLTESRLGGRTLVGGGH